MRVRVFGVAIAIVLALSSLTSAAAASAFANPAFQQQWQQGEAITPNFWGPLSTARDGQQEPYKEASGGQRLVQYFDKGRMELTNGAVTNGLLATEIVTGRIQTGDNTFEDRPQPNIPVAGDADNTAPTYAGLATQGAALLNATKSTPGVPVSAFIAADGTLSGGGNASADAATVIGAYDDVTKHNVPQSFADYRSKAGLPTIGYAISEPFRATVKVGGTPKDVMVQVFERRVLTYTASNPDAFKVEMGNIGQHYYQWRYAGGDQTQTFPAGSLVFQYPEGWTVDNSKNAGDTLVTLIGPTPTLQMSIQIYDQTGSLDDEIAVYKGAAQKLAAGGITRDEIVNGTIAGEQAKFYAFDGKRQDGSPVSGLIAVVFHGGKAYAFITLADVSPLPNSNDIRDILNSVAFTL